MSATIFTLDAYAMFKRGMDTFDIAKVLQRDEPSVLREISQRRSRVNGLASPYPPYSQPAEAPIAKGAARQAYFDARNNSIMKRRREGATLSKIADEHGITPVRVWQIVRLHDEVPA